MSAPSPQNPGLLNWALVLFLGVIWGGAFMSVKLALEGFGPWTVAAGRTSIAAVFLLAIGAVLGQGLRTIVSRQARMSVVLVGAGSVALPFALLCWGQQYVPSAFAGVAMGSIPLLVLPLVYMFSPEEGIGPRRIIGMCIGFVGLMILVAPGALDGAAGPLTFWGRLACFGAAMAYAVGSIVTRRAPKIPPIAFASATLVVAAVILVPLALIIEGVPQDIPPAPMTALLYAAIFPTALAAVIRVRIIKTAGSVFMSLSSYQVPVWSVILGVSLMDETLPPQLFIALALILIGIGISQSRALSGLFRRP
ncbi:DMT family transporter [Litoreibacter roseus]|uniref:Multidrug transporter n=1 Tax=Litoreibacter roseus TaxID=2601869 RepID=A0A6N6JKK1_9RHOB|nr:DMT family transporter [Litoreibacter roseus]GFE65959.1 multidrug transporter [Litoreibacter roseus]